MAIEDRSTSPFTEQIPAENLKYGNVTLDLPFSPFGEKFSGKNTDFWFVGDRVYQFDSDRMSAKNKVVCTAPGVGDYEGEISRWWKLRTMDIANDYAGSPAPPITIARRAHTRIDLEWIFRSYFVKSSSKTSVHYKYHVENKRKIYGHTFPDNLIDNQMLPMGTIFTPTTKGDESDDEITPEQAREIVKEQTNRKGVYEEILPQLEKLNMMGQEVLSSRGLILADTKYEVGLDKDGRWMVIDKVHTPHTSRIWIKDSYRRALAKGIPPQSLDTEVLRRMLTEKGFDGSGPIPRISPSEIKLLSDTYRDAYLMITREKKLPKIVPLEEIRSLVIEHAQIA